MKEVPQEANTIKDDDFSTHFAVKTFGIFVHFAVYWFGRNENVIIYMRAMLSHLLNAFFYIGFQYGLTFHFIARDGILFGQQRNLHVA